MNKFKVGDKVRAVMSDEYYGLCKGVVYTVVSVHPMGNIELKGIDVIQWSPDRFELVQEGTTTIQATAKRKDDDLFTPDCLVGVETDKGYIDVVRRVYLTPFHTKPITFVHTTGSLYFTDANNLRYYISDNSDETVSFEEYVKMFYNGDAYEG